MTATTGIIRPGELRNKMVDRLIAAGHVNRPDIERALRTVPRHRFVPEATLHEAYADATVTIKASVTGNQPVSYISEPNIVAIQLNQLGLQPDDNVLEIGTGPGYTSALISEIVGSAGKVMTVDIDPDITDHARRALASTGYDLVSVFSGDGAEGHPGNAPYNAIIVTTGPWDLPTAWDDQLAEGGTLVVPLTWRGQTRSLIFRKVDGHLRADESTPCGFVPMLGPHQDGERTGRILDQVALHWDSDQVIDRAGLTLALAATGTAVWTTTTFRPDEPIDLLWLRLTGSEPGTCRLAVTKEAQNAGICNPFFPSRNPAIVEGHSIAYLSARRMPGTCGGQRYELGATGHGSAGSDLAERLCRQIQVWGEDRENQPVIRAYPANTPEEQLEPGMIIDKSLIRLVISY